MATIPRTTIPGGALRGVPNVNFGPRSTAEDFGAGQARDLDRLGQAVQRAGSTVAGFSAEIHEQRAQNEAMEAATLAKEDISRYRTQIFNEYKGDKAYDTTDDLQRYSQGRMDEFSKNFKSERARNLFYQQMQSYNSHNSVLANQHVIQQSEQYRITSLKSSNAQHLNEASTLSNDPAAVLNSIRQIHANNAELYRGAPPEFMELENAKSSMSVAEAVAKNVSTQYGPAAALDFLDQEEISGQFTDKNLRTKYNQLKEKYKAVRQNDDIRRQAISLVDGNVIPDGPEAGKPATADAIYRYAVEKYPDDTQAQDQLIKETGLYSKMKASADNSREADIRQDMWTQWAEAGYDVAKIPPEAMRHPDVYKEMLSYATTLSKVNSEKMVPNFEELDGLYAKSPEEISAWIKEDGNYSKLLLWAAGDKDEVNRILKKRRGEGGGGSGGGDAFDFNDAFAQNFGALNKTWLMGNPETYDPKNQDHVRQMGNARHIFNQRVASTREELGRSLSFNEKQAVLYQLIADVNDGKEKLDRPTYDRDMEARLAAEGAQIPVSQDMLTPDQKTLFDGPAMDVKDDNGNTVRFGIPDTHYIKTNLHANVAEFKPDRAHIAYDRGTYRGIAFERGDIIAENKGGVAVFMSNGEMRYPPVLNPMGYGSGSRSGRPESLPMPEPAKSSEMKKMEKDGAKWEWTGHEWVWVQEPKHIKILPGLAGAGKEYDVETRVYYDRHGRVWVQEPKHIKILPGLAGAGKEYDVETRVYYDRHGRKVRTEAKELNTTYGGKHAD